MTRPSKSGLSLLKHYPKTNVSQGQSPPPEIVSSPSDPLSKREQIHPHDARSLNDTLVIGAGEFGGTSHAQIGDGRDDNNKATSLNGRRRCES